MRSKFMLIAFDRRLFRFSTALRSGDNQGGKYLPSTSHHPVMREASRALGHTEDFEHVHYVCFMYIHTSISIASRALDSITLRMRYIN